MCPHTHTRTHTPQILGIVMTSVGSAGMSNQYSALVGSTLPTGVTVLGVFVMLISLVGCVGAKRENRIILAIVTFSLFSHWLFRPLYHTMFAFEDFVQSR